MIVENAGEVEFSFKVYATPYTVIGDSYEPDFNSETNFTQISRWISFDQTQFTIAPGERQTVNFHIAVPKDVPAGGQYATIFAETLNDNTSPSEGIQMVARVGLIVYAKVAGETRETAEIINFSLPTFYSAFNVPDITATSRVKNTGNTDLEAIYSFKISSIFNNAVHEDRRVQIVFPETERQIEIKWDDTPLLGLFKVNFSVVIGDANQEINAVVLVIPPWLIIITLLLLTFLIVWIIIKLKRRGQLRSRFKL